MIQQTRSQPEFTTVADLVGHLDGIPARRIRLRPFPGTATEEDVLEVYARERLLCELVDGILVEKAMGYYESVLAIVLGHLLQTYLDQNNVGIVAGADGMLRLCPGMIRIPDLSFVSWDKFPGGKVPSESIPDLVPDLAVEVLSEGNTKAEIKRKRREYFEAGTKLLWVLDPKRRHMEVWTSVNDCTLIREGDLLTGGEVLPGFSVRLEEVFRRAQGRTGR